MAQRIVLYFFMLFFVCACQGSSGEDQASTDAELRIGAIFSLSGYGAPGGDGEHKAMQLAVEEINSTGGIAGKPVEVLIEDNQSDFRQTATAARKLISVQHVSVLLGPNWAEFSEIAAPIAQAEKIVMLTASGYTETLAPGKDFVFSLLPAHRFSVRPLMDAILKKAPKKIALIETQNAYCHALSESSRRYLAEHGSPVWQTFSFQPDEHDYRAIIARLQDEKVDAILLYLLEGVINTAFLRQLRAVDYSGDIFSGAALAYDDFLREDPSLAEGVIYFDYNILASNAFLSKFRQRFGIEPQLGAGKSYDSVFLIKRAVEKCGPKPSEVRKCLSAEDYRGVTGPIRFDSDGNFSGSENITELMQVRNGKFERITVEDL